MPHSEQLTPAQRALLDYVGRSEAGILIRCLSTTLSISISKYIPDHIGEEASTPGVVTLESWFFTLELIEHLASIGAEPPPA